MNRVLVVDDALFMRANLKRILEKHSFTVVGEAENGLVAVSKYKELKPDIVTLDITMPERDGIWACKEIKAFDSNANIVMISAMGQETMVREAIINGAKTFILKPFKEEFVIQTLSKISN